MHYVNRNGKDHRLAGVHIEKGDRAFQFPLVGVDEVTIQRGGSSGKTTVILSVPSLDTPVCDEEARTFIKRAGEIPYAEVVVVSMDLPYAMARWLEYNPTTVLTLGSDHRGALFGITYGTLIDELRILTRAAFVVNKVGVVTFAEYMPELNKQVDFDAIVSAAKATK